MSILRHIKQTSAIIVRCLQSCAQMVSFFAQRCDLVLQKDDVLVLRVNFLNVWSLVISQTLVFLVEHHGFFAKPVCLHLQFGHALVFPHFVRLIIYFLPEFLQVLVNALHVR